MRDVTTWLVLVALLTISVYMLRQLRDLKSKVAARERIADLEGHPPPEPEPPPGRPQFTVIRGGKAAAIVAAAFAPVALVRHHLGATAVVAATAVVLSLTPSLAPHVTELPDERIALPPSISPPPLEPRREPPTLDTGEDTAPDTQPDSAAPDTAISEVEPLDVVDTEQDTPTDTEPPTEPQPPPGRREPPPRREPEPDEPPDGPPEPRCVEVAVPPVVDLPACLAKVDKIAP